MNLLLSSVIILGALGLISAVVLYFVAQKFKVEEDSRIEQVESLLPGANCGGCGYPGCHGFAEACVKAKSLDGMLCTVGGMATMTKVSEVLGMAVSEVTPKVAVVRCNGTCENRPRTNKFDGAQSCSIVKQLYTGETGCSWGCLGLGDCAAACQFDAIKINPETGIAEVDEDKCTACGACVKACPNHIIELRNKGPKGRRVYVRCSNQEKGGVARKACKAACIGCGKCEKTCPFGAITVENNLAYVDYTKCRLCRKCVAECPTGALFSINFPTPVPVAKKPVAVKPATLKVDAEQVKPAQPAESKAATPTVQNVSAQEQKAQPAKVAEPVVEKVIETKPQTAPTTNTVVETTPADNSQKEIKNDNSASDNKVQSQEN